MFGLGRARKTYRLGARLYRRKGKKLSAEARSEVENSLRNLHAAVKRKDRKEANRLAAEVTTLLHTHFKRSWFDWFRETVVAIVVALIIAIVVRQMFFEPMEIPSGSMRPTYQELDRLIASKTTFGINIPCMPRQFYFNPDLVKRTAPVIFTSEDMDIPDQDTTFFLFPSKRRLIKRCMGKPGDSLYFYGGQIYGVDAEGNDLPELREFPLVHVPFITFEGKVKATPIGTTFYQMNEPIGRITAGGVGEVMVDGEWVPEKERPYGEFFGIGNFAMARLLTADQVALYTNLKPDGEGTLYLELRHNPTLSGSHIGQDERGQFRPMLTPSVSLISLGQSDLDRLFSNLYTCRFIVEGGTAFPDRLENKLVRQSPYLPTFSDVPDGRYEFTKGVLYEVAFGGILRTLPADHPLYARTPKNIQRLFNIGMEMITLYAPHSKNQPFFPSRFAFFRGGDLWVMNAPLFKADDKKLQDFVAQELKTRYPFVDHGAPKDANFIRQFGYTLPEGGYLALGDNYAASSDSRAFGPVPGSNLRGSPTFLLWPPGHRWGYKDQPPRPWITLPRVMVWGVAAIALIIYLIVRRKQNKLNI